MGYIIDYPKPYASFFLSAPNGKCKKNYKMYIGLMGTAIFGF
jgi:hypothetical protein